MPLTKVTPSNLHQTVKTMVTTMVNETAVDSADVVTLINANAIDSADATLIINSNIAAKSTSDLSEGTNLYYTDARVDARLSGGSVGNIVTTGYLAGPATFTIDPAAVGDNTGTVVIAGSLQVDGTTTTINSTTMTVDDLNLTLASGAANAAAANGAGITVDGASATITYDGTNDKWDFNKNVNVTGTVSAVQLDITAGTDAKIYTSNAISEVGAGNFAIQSVNSAGSALKPLGFRAEDIRFATGPEERMRIDSSGRLGIGTTTPADKVHIKNDTGTTVYKAEVNSNSIVGLGILKTGSTSQEWAIADGVTVNGKLQIYDVTDSRSVMTFDGAGNVGIGTASPDSLLHLQKTRSGSISGGSSDTGAVIKLHTEAQWESGYGNNPAASTNDYLGSIEFSTGDGSAGEGVRAAIRGTVDSYYNQNSIVFETCDHGDTTLDERMRVLHNGNVGIGTASPDTKFHVYNSSGNTYAKLESNANNTRSALLPWAKKSDGSTLRGYIGVTGDANKMEVATSTNDSIHFYTNNNPTNNGIFLKADGNVGIGTDNPTNTYGPVLHIRGTNPNLRLDGTGSGSWAWISMNTADAGDSRAMGTASDGTFRITNVRDSLDSGIQFAIKQDGNVGIGTTSPEHKLHVKSTAHDEPIALFEADAGGGGDVSIRLEGGASGNPDEIYIEFSDRADPTNSFTVGLDDDASKLFFGYGALGTSNGHTQMVLQSDGKVGMGITSFSNYGARLNLAMSGGSNNALLASINTTTSGTRRHIDFFDGSSTSRKGSIETNGTATTYNTTSDRRLKDNIQHIADATDKLMDMKPVTHTWIANPEAPQVHGFIAQEMQEVVPEAVSGDAESDEMMSMDYGRITPVIVAALQDALKEIKELRTRISELENK